MASMDTTQLSVGLFLFTAHAIAAAHCYDEAATRYGVPAPLLRAIAQVESSGNPSVMNRTQQARTGNYDIGLMQINSTWLPRLARYGITEADLLDACTNLHVGAWILRQHLAESGADWNGVGAYNAACRNMSRDNCAEIRNRYAWRVYRALQQITASTTESTTVVAPAAAFRAVPQSRRIQSVVLADAPSGARPLSTHAAAPSSLRDDWVSAVRLNASSQIALTDETLSTGTLGTHEEPTN